jgi:hypothetical protein
MDGLYWPASKESAMKKPFFLTAAFACGLFAAPALFTALPCP